MPFRTKIQPIDDSDGSSEIEIPFPETMKQMPKSRLKRLFERQFSVKNTDASVVPPHLSRGGGSGEFEPSSVCLAKMVVNFMEDNNNGEKQKCGRSRCSCFTGSGTESSDDESDWSDDLKASSSSGEVRVTLKSLVLCTSIRERSLLADVTKIVETSKSCKRKDESCLEIVVNELVSLGYDAALCKSRWEKSSSYPAGEYKYVDVITGGERLLLDIDFKSNFEIARATKTYKSILQTLPCIFVGKEDRLQKIIIFVCEAVKKSLKKKGLHVPPWRRAEYVKSMWMAPYVRGPDAEDKQEPVDVLTKSVLKKLIREIQKDFEEKVDMEQYAMKVYACIERKVKHLEVKREHLSGQRDMLRLNISRC